MSKYRRVIAILILSLLTIAGLFRLGNIELSAASLAGLQWRWLAVAFVIYYSGVLVRGLRWRRILKVMGWPVSYLYAETLLVAGLFLSAILPARAGDIGRVAMLRQDHRVPLSQGIASIATERALDIFAILVLVTTGAVLALRGQVPAEIFQLIVGAAGLFGLGLAGLLVTPGLEKWLRRWSGAAFIPPAGRVLSGKLLDFGFALVHGVRALGRNPLALALAAGESLYIWLADALLVYFSLVTVSSSSPVSLSLFASMVSNLAAAVPITPGALGQFDAVLLSTLALFGVSRGQASLAILLVRLISLWLLIPLSGLVTYVFGFSRALNLNGPGLAAGETSPSPAEG